jgi:ABC-type transport system substrate-binding protein
VSEDTTGRIAAAAARAWDVTPDGLTYTFHLRPNLRFGDGRAITSADFRRALESGLSRLDHSLYPWLLSPVAGADRLRPGRPLPPLGIATPDDHTLVLRLARADPTLLHKLAIAGASAPWSSGASDRWAGGGGPYRLVAHQPGRRMLLARESGAGPDTVRIEFAIGGPRARALLRRGDVDLLWPVPPGMLGEALPRDYRTVERASRPPRWLWLVLRADLPPTTRDEARRALAHGINRAEVQSVLGARGGEVGAWLPGGHPIDFPPQDAEAVRTSLDRGKLGRSLHVVMTYSADGAAAEVARTLQSGWARVSLDVELRPLHAGAFTAAALSRSGAQLLLVESQAPLSDPAAELAMVVEPRRGPPVAPFHTGWNTREFDRWIGPQPPETPVDIDLVERRVGEELSAIPLARLPWLWVERPGSTGVGWHPRYGPAPAGSVGPNVAAHQSR